MAYIPFSHLRVGSVIWLTHSPLKLDVAQPDLQRQTAGKSCDTEGRPMETSLLSFRSEPGGVSLFAMPLSVRCACRNTCLSQTPHSHRRRMTDSDVPLREVKAMVDMNLLPYERSLQMDWVSDAPKSSAGVVKNTQVVGKSCGAFECGRPPCEAKKCLSTCTCTTKDTLKLIETFLSNFEHVVVGVVGVAVMVYEGPTPLLPTPKRSPLSQRPLPAIYERDQLLQHREHQMSY